MPGTADYDVRLVVRVVLGASLCIAPIFILMRMTRERKKEPVVFVSSDSAWRHAALIWLIRGTYVITAIFAAILLLAIMVALPMGAVGETITDASNSWAFRITMAFAVLTTILLFGLIMKKVFYEGFRKDFRKVNTDSVANFSSIFALLLAIDWYLVLPPHLPKAIVDYFGSNPFFYPFDEQRSPGGPTYRGMLSFVAFYIFFRLIKAYLMHILDLDSPEPPQNLPTPPPTDPDIPEFPQKSPLVQL